MSSRKYQKGKQIRTIDEFANSKKTFFIWNNKTRHRGVIESLQYRTLYFTILYGRLFEAELIKKEPGHEC